MSHEPVQDLGDTTIMGYKCKKLRVEIAQERKVGYNKSTFKSEYTYYVTKELAYPHSFASIKVTNDIFPIAEIEGVLLKGTYRVVTTSKNKMSQKYMDDMAQSWSFSDPGFDKIDDAQFASPQ